jgi:hypothetical protein
MYDHEADADPAPERTKTYAEIAGDYAETASNLLADLPPAAMDATRDIAIAHCLQLAQVAATLSVGARLADLTQRLEKSIEYVGDRIDAQEAP